MKRIAVIYLAVALLFIPVTGLSCDLNGNTNDNEVNNTDTTPPVISEITVSEMTIATATISWNTDEPATGYIEYGPDTGYGYSFPHTSDTTAEETSHSLTLSGLSLIQLINLEEHLCTG